MQSASALISLLAEVTNSTTRMPSSISGTSGPCSSSAWVPLWAASIGAVAAITTPFVRDFLITIWDDRRKRTRAQSEILRNYLAPLSESCQKLVWRFGEMFIDQRYQWLMTTTLPLEYNQYKRQSTLYRIASLLGWIRAISLELNALPRGHAGFSPPISRAISQVQSALADGPHVEIYRLRQLCSVWGIEYDQIDELKRQQLATQLEVKLFSLAGTELKYDSEPLRNFDSDKKREVCTGLAEFLCGELRRAPLKPEVIDESIHKAIESLSYREALVYRDWQDAIGDAVLEKDEVSVRRFKIVGYEKFDVILEEKRIWMDVFKTSIIDLDMEKIDPNDFRYKQVKDLAIAVSDILVSIANKEKDLVDDAVLEVCAQLKELSES
jgi:hypothetical protein